jgi:hypothetical protein
LALLSGSGQIVFVNASNAVLVSQLKGKRKCLFYAVSNDGRCITTVSSDLRFVVNLFRLDDIYEPEEVVNSVILDKK